MIDHCWCCYCCCCTWKAIDHCCYCCCFCWSCCCTLKAIDHCCYFCCCCCTWKTINHCCYCCCCFCCCCTWKAIDHCCSCFCCTWNRHTRIDKKLFGHFNFYFYLHHHKHPSGIGNGTSKRPNMPRYQFYCCCCCTTTFVVPGLIRSPLVIRIRYALQEREMGHAISPIGLVIKCFHITVVLLHTLWTLLHKSQVFPSNHHFVPINREQTNQNFSHY